MFVGGVKPGPSASAVIGVVEGAVARCPILVERRVDHEISGVLHLRHVDLGSARHDQA